MGYPFRRDDWLRWVFAVDQILGSVLLSLFLLSIAAKHRGMKKARISGQGSHYEQILEPPAFLKIGNEVVRTLKEFVDAADHPW
jgi:hypothetical protein